MRRSSRILIPHFIPNQNPWQTLIFTFTSSDQPPLSAQISPSTTPNFSFSPPPPYPYLLKRCFSVHGVTPLPISSAKTPDLVAEVLVNRLGFSISEAVSIAAKVSPLKSQQRLVSVAHFFEQIGLDKTQIRMLVSSVPNILRCGVEKNLRPKFTLVQEIGITGSDLVNFISNNPLIIGSSLHATIIPALELLRSVFHSDKEKMVRVIKRSVGFIRYARPHIELLRSYGVPDHRIQIFLIRYSASVFCWKRKWFEDAVLKVTEELGIPPESGMFIYAVGVIACMGKKNLEDKYEIFKSYGWTQSDALTLTRKCPSILHYSEASIRTRLDYFMKELGFHPLYLASFPVLLKYSLENRIFPRNAVLRALKHKSIHGSYLNFYSAMAVTDAEFIRRFVLEYKDTVPDICDVYFAYKADFPVKSVDLSKTARRSLK